MNYSVVTIPPFDRQLKRLAKKYHSLKSDLAELGKQLKENPVMGKSPSGRTVIKYGLQYLQKAKVKVAGQEL